MYAVITLNPETLEECEPTLTENVHYEDDHIRVDCPDDDYAPYRFIHKDLVVLVKPISIKQLNDAIRAL